MGKIKLTAGRWTWSGKILSYSGYIIAGLILIILVPFLPSYLQGIVSKALIFAIFAMSLNLLCGYTGLFSLGHAAYFAAAAYTSSLIMVRFGIESFWLVALGGILVATLLAFLFGFVALRVSGVFFLLVTLAIGQLLESVALKWQTVTGGTNGLIRTGYPNLGLPWITLDSLSFYYLVFIILVVTLFLLYRLIKSPFGVALQGIRDSETRMRSLGYNTRLYKHIAFTIAGLFAGVAGVLLTYYSTVLIPAQFDVLNSTLVMLMVIIGSDRVFWGPILGAIVITFIQHYASLYVPARWPLILGAFFIISVTFLRGGISIYLIKLWQRIRYHYGSVEG